MTTSQRLAAMFEADRNDPGWDRKFPAYSFVHSEIGAQPWHPPAEQVWLRQGTPEDYDDPERVAEVWQILTDLHADYRRSRDG